MYSCICTSSASTADCNTRRSLTWSALSTFTAAVAKGNVFAIQFHPEKSQSAGKRLLDAYRAWLDQS